MMGNSTVNAPMSVVFRFIPSQTMPRTSAAMMFSECTMSDCSTKDMPAIDPCDTVAMTGVANPIMAQQSKGLQNEDASTLGETVRVGTSARPSRRAIHSWPSSAATLSVASAAMVSAMVDASSVKNARYGTADSTDPSTISTFAMSGPSANNARAQQKKQQVVPTPMQVPAATSTAGFCRSVDRHISATAALRSAIAATRGLRPNRRGARYAPAKNTANAATLLSDSGVFQRSWACSPSVVSGKRANPHSENELSARKHAKPVAESRICAMVFCMEPSLRHCTRYGCLKRRLAC